MIAIKYQEILEGERESHQRLELKIGELIKLVFSRKLFAADTEYSINSKIVISSYPVK